MLTKAPVTKALWACPNASCQSGSSRKALACPSVSPAAMHASRNLAPAAHPASTLAAFSAERD